MRGVSAFGGIVAVVLSFAACGGLDDLAPDGGVLGDAGTDGAGVPGAPTAAELLAKIATCDHMIGGFFEPSVGAPATIPICGLPMAMFWKADLDVDCDGKMSAKCSLATDPAYQNQTAATDSLGMPLDAAALPYVVVPGKSARFDYRAAGIPLGSVIAVIYNNRVEYGVFGDIGPVAIIGEASYRMAELLGIDPDPSTGGTQDSVAYIAFVGSVVTPIEDHGSATQIGIEHARALLAAP